MRLRDYLNRERMTVTAFARRLDTRPQVVDRYLSGSRMPDFMFMWRIEIATKGAVTANDFHEQRRLLIQSKRINNSGE